MTILPIRIFPDPILRQKTEEIKEINKELIDFGFNMLETMQAARGIGLAAPQVGKLVKLITIQIPENEPMIMFNPKVEKSFGKRNVEIIAFDIPKKAFNFNGLWFQ